jgi:hypothetical protein
VPVVIVMPSPRDIVHVPDSGQRFAFSPHSQLPFSVYQLDSYAGSRFVGS